MTVWFLQHFMLCNNGACCSIIIKKRGLVTQLVLSNSAQSDPKCSLADVPHDKLPTQTYHDMQNLSYQLHPRNALELNKIITAKL